jgi:SAM-dependent MidA family methyltransferase
MINYLTNLISASPNNLISYAEYMEAVLYHPELGYYMKKKEKIGRKGDFITTSNISNIYGQIMAKWFAHICVSNELKPIFCEIGGGNGRFAHAFLQEWQKSIKTPLAYIIVESSAYHRELQYELLKDVFSIQQVERIEQLEAFEGMIFSNELFDALPVHVVQKKYGQFFEMMVGIKNEQLYEVEVPLINQELLSFLQVNNMELKENQRIEVPLTMGNILEQISQVLTKGLVVTADYGYTNEEWQQPARASGSLRGYYQHKLITDVLRHPGEMDITSHIHLDWLIQKGDLVGLKELGKLRQDEFLLKIGILKELENHYDPNPFSEISKRNRAIRGLIMPSGISSYFQIVLQQKGLNVTNQDVFIV